MRNTGHFSHFKVQVCGQVFWSSSSLTGRTKCTLCTTVGVKISVPVLVSQFVLKVRPPGVPDVGWTGRSVGVGCLNMVQNVLRFSQLWLFLPVRFPSVFLYCVRQVCGGMNILRESIAENRVMCRTNMLRGTGQDGECCVECRTPSAVERCFVQIKPCHFS